MGQQEIESKHPTPGALSITKMSSNLIGNEGLSSSSGTGSSSNSPITESAPINTATDRSSSGTSSLSQQLEPIMPPPPPPSVVSTDLCRTSFANPLNLNINHHSTLNTSSNNLSRRNNGCVIEPFNRIVVNNMNRNITSQSPDFPYNRSDIDFNLLKSEQARLNTFLNPANPWPLDFVRPCDCAKAGFFYLQDGDKVQCAFCRGVAGEWEIGDVPLTEHKKHFPRCPFLCHLPVGNVPIGARGNSTGSSPTSSSPEPEPMEMGFDVCGPFLPPGFTNNGPAHSHHQTDSALRGGAQPLINAEPLNDVTRLAINTGCGPARRHLVTMPARLKTFTKEWPAESTGQSAERMSEAGFFYIGTQDHVKCFYCDGGLRNWEPGDDPWFEHARWFSKCPFVLLMKGQEYVREVGLARPPVATDSSDEESPSNSQKSSIGSTSSEDPEDEIPTSHRSGSSGSDSGLSSEEHNTSGPEAVWSSDEEMCPVQASVAGPVGNSTETVTERKVDLEEEIRQLKEARQCKICMDNEVSVVFLPCGHLVSCVSCATALSTCALCREPIKAVIRTYMS